MARKMAHIFRQNPNPEGRSVVIFPRPPKCSNFQRNNSKRERNAPGAWDGGMVEGEGFRQNNDCTFLFLILKYVFLRGV